MTTSTIASISLTWDEYGSVSCTLKTFIPANPYQEQDAIALGATLTVASQLGVLSPRYSLDLCRRLVDYFHGRTHTPELIQFPLSRARIDLHKKDDTIVSTFEPSFIQGGTMEPEEAVRRLLTTTVFTLTTQLQAELVAFMKNMLLGTTLYYLSVVLPDEMARPSFSLDRVTPELNLSMIGFCHTIYHQWKGGPTLPPDRFRSILHEVENALASIETGAPPRQQPSQPREAVSKPVQASQPHQVCDVCGVTANTAYVEFYENVGALVMRFRKSVKGNLCKACIDRYFWDFTGKTVLLGWWGVISFFVTPFILINNALRFIATRSMPNPPVRLGKGPSPFWVFSSVAGGLVILAILWGIFRPLFGFGTSATGAPSDRVSSQPPPATVTRAVAMPAPTSTQSCTRWDNVGTQHRGKRVCVYGTVNEVYSRDPYASVIRFGPEPGDFFMVDTEWTYDGLGQGDCVRAINTVSAMDDGRLYMDVQGDLLHCP